MRLFLGKITLPPIPPIPPKKSGGMIYDANGLIFLFSYYFYGKGLGLHPFHPLFSGVYLLFIKSFFRFLIPKLILKIVYKKVGELGDTL